MRRSPSGSAHTSVALLPTVSAHASAFSSDCTSISKRNSSDRLSLPVKVSTSSVPASRPSTSSAKFRAVLVAIARSVLLDARAFERQRARGLQRDAAALDLHVAAVQLDLRPAG